MCIVRAVALFSTTSERLNLGLRQRVNIRAQVWLNLRRTKRQ